MHLQHLKSVFQQAALLSSLAAVAALGACGGGGYDAPPPPADPLESVSDAAKQTTAGLVGYLDTLSKNTSESREAIDLGNTVLPSNEDGEPASI